MLEDVGASGQHIDKVDSVGGLADRISGIDVERNRGTVSFQELEKEEKKKDRRRRQKELESQAS
jgi:hypothetical protein